MRRSHALTAAIANTAECIDKFISGFDLSVASLAISIAEPATVISRHKLLFPSISGRMVVIPCKERGITCEARGITHKERSTTCEARGTTCKARDVTALGALPYGPL